MLDDTVQFAVKDEVGVTLEIQTKGEPGDGLFYAIKNGVMDCADGGLSDDECTDTPQEGLTPTKYYYVGTQSFLSRKKNEIRFKSHYAAFLNGTSEEYQSLEDVLGGTEIASLDLAVEGKYLYADLAEYPDSFPKTKQAGTISVSFVFANSDDGCPKDLKWM